MSTFAIGEAGVVAGGGVFAGGGVVEPAFWIFMLTTSLYVAPAALRAVAFSWCVPFANLVVSSTHDMPSATLVSALSSVASR